MSGELSQSWYAVPNLLPAFPGDVVASAVDIHGAGKVTAEGPASSSSGCYANHVDSHDNNAVHSGSIRLPTGREDAVMALSKQDGGLDHVLLDNDPADGMECSGEFDPTSNIITYALQLLGGSRTSSYSTQMAWDDEDELTVEQAYAAAGARASAFPAAGHSYSSSTPRANTAARICPPAPVRRLPSIRLVTAAELGVPVNAQ